MNSLTWLLTIVAQTTPPANPAGPAGPAGPPQSAASALIMPALLVGMLVFFFVMQRGQQKRAAAQKKQLHDSIAKNDKVLTIGGIIGTVSQVRDHEIVLKIDENTNTKMVFLKRAIQQKITDDEPAELEER